jgi:hypothetical protein
MCFSSSGTWEILLCCISIAWCDSGISGISYCCCCRTATKDTHLLYICVSSGCCCWDSVCTTYASTLSGYNPNNVYCSYACLSWTAYRMCSLNFYHCICNAVSIFSSNLFSCQFSKLINQNSIDNAWGTTSACFDLSAYNNCTFSNFNFYSNSDGISAIIGGYSYNGVCLEGYVIQCYCSPAANDSCLHMNLYSLKDYTAEETVLDSSGVLNWLAVSYS